MNNNKKVNENEKSEWSVKDTYEIKSIPLWCIFLPFSPLVLMIMIMIRWARYGMNASDPRRSKAVRLTTLGCAAAMLVLWLPGVLITNRHMETGETPWLIGVLAWIYIIFIISSLIMREIDYRSLVKVCGEKIHS